MNNFFGNAIDKAVNFVDKATQIPQKGIEFFEGVNDKLIDVAQQFRQGKDEATRRAADNITDTKVKQTGGQAAQWLQKPKNLAIVAGTVLLLIIAIRKI
jgi:hypothetical protein